MRIQIRHRILRALPVIIGTCMMLAGATRLTAAPPASPPPGHRETAGGHRSPQSGDARPSEADKREADKREGDKRAAGRGSDRLPTLRLPTLGGKQFWTDQLVHGGWRIQKNVLIGSHRLLDPRNGTWKSGTWSECLAAWHQMKVDRNVPPLKKHVVLVLHGLGRSRASMKGMEDYLRRKGDFTVSTVGYASTREPIAEHARALTRVIAGLENVERVSFVAHSMGNIVIRHMLGEQQRLAKSKRLQVTFQAFVMLAPPNQGAHLARQFQDNFLFRKIAGDSGQQLSARWRQEQARLGIPSFPFGIVAGGKGDSKGYNPLLPGDDDLVVTVTETRLAGAADFRRVPSVHTTIMDVPQVQAFTLQFLRHGYFTAAAQREPIKKQNPVHSTTSAEPRK